MASTFTNNLLLEKIGTNEQDGTWGDIYNLNLDAIDETFAGHIKVTVSNGATTLTQVTTSTSPHRHEVIEVIGTLTSAANLVLPDIEKTYIIKNSTGGSFGFRVTVAGGSGVAVSVSQGHALPIYTVGGAAFKRATKLPITLGGTGVSTTSQLWDTLKVEATREQTGIVKVSGANNAVIVSSSLALLPKSFNTQRQIITQVTAFVSAGTYVVSAPPNTQEVLFWLQGAGGAGGGTSVSGNSHSSGGGGDSGPFAHGIFLFVGTTLSVVVGAGGVAATAVTGGTGGLTEITGYVSASGGVGGDGDINPGVIEQRFLGRAGETTVGVNYSTSTASNVVVFSDLYNNFGARSLLWTQSVNLSAGGTISGMGGDPPGGMGCGGDSIVVRTAATGFDGNRGYYGGGGSGSGQRTLSQGFAGGRGGDGWVRIAFITF